MNEASKTFKWIGTRPVRPDGVEKVNGKAKYGADILLPGLLHGNVLRSPHAHARILSIDTSRAEAHPEVKAVVTAKDLADFSDKPVGDRHGSEKVLARDKVFYKGQAIVEGRRSDSDALYDEATSTFEADDVYDQGDATGFIRLQSLRLRTFAEKRMGEGE